MKSYYCNTELQNSVLPTNHLHYSTTPPPPPPPPQPPLTTTTVQQK